MASTKEILEKYGRKLKSEIEVFPSSVNYSEEYIKFKKEMIPELSRYEIWAQSLGNLFRVKLAEKDKAKIEKDLASAHLEVDASQVATLSFLAMLLTLFLTSLSAAVIYLLAKKVNVNDLVLFCFLGLIASIFIFYYTYSMPKRLANSWRLRASSEMVPAILYIIIYMKHTSNLERAIEFAAKHLEGPLKLDFNKIFYDVEIGKYPSIKQSLDAYLEQWRDYAPEFIESFHLIESSLYEPNEQRRIEILEKSLQIILDGVYERMLKFSREIRSPLTNVYMLGIILPTLGLALLPLASALLGGMIKIHHVFLIFNVLIPMTVFYLISEILLKRPGGYGSTSIIELNPKYQSYLSKKHTIKAFLIAAPFFILGILPFLFQISFLTESFSLKSDYKYSELGIPFFEDSLIFDFKCVGDSTPNCSNGRLVGPFGLIGVILGAFIPLSLMLFFYIKYRGKTKELMKAREESKKLETEFNNSLFQLGNRLGEGVPAEIAIGRVAEITVGQRTHDFFAITNNNMQEMGMSLEQSIFDKKRGSIIYYPSSIIATSMRIFIESVKKGLNVAARSLISISEYIKNIEKINQRLKDLLAEVVSDMKSNMSFLAPILAGMVVGLSSMIVVILNKISSFTAESIQIQGFGSITNIMKIFELKEMIPPYFIQLSIGLYLIEIIFILSKALVTIDSGKDALREKYDISIYLKAGISLYLIIAIVSTILLSLLASFVLQ